MKNLKLILCALCADVRVLLTSAVAVYAEFRCCLYWWRVLLHMKNEYNKRSWGQNLEELNFLE